MVRNIETLSQAEAEWWVNETAGYQYWDVNLDHQTKAVPNWVHYEMHSFAITIVYSVII